MTLPNERYEKPLRITSQLYFCSIPFRYDSTSRCTFGCGYCFAKTRQGYGRSAPIQNADPAHLENRFREIAQGKQRSAIDEFLIERVPIQFGGMSDPFVANEYQSGLSLTAIKTLNKYNYPFLISTKSKLVSTKIYLDQLSQANVLVRFSTSVVGIRSRHLIDRGCSPHFEIFNAINALASRDVATSLRLQPIFPGYEDEAVKLVERAANAGAKHISAEFLKVPIDADIKFSKPTKELLGGRPIDVFRSLGAKKIGREYILPINYRKHLLLALRDTAHRYGLSFGFADNDLLHFSDGRACCSAADIYLKDFRLFDANVVTSIKDKRPGQLISFPARDTRWYPTFGLTHHLNSKAVKNLESKQRDDWESVLAAAWEANFGVYSPTFFYGVVPSSKKDSFGLSTFRRLRTEFD